tara:strand:+ start:1605 stop:1829 length:225 start_codon:yes stop_codon:yes gene_type:complete
MITTDSKVEDLLDRLQEEKRQSEAPKKVQKVIDSILKILVKDQVAYNLRPSGWYKDSVDYETQLEDQLDKMLTK